MRDLEKWFGVPLPGNRPHLANVSLIDLPEPGRLRAFDQAVADSIETLPPAQHLMVCFGVNDYKPETREEFEDLFGEVCGGSMFDMLNGGR